MGGAVTTGKGGAAAGAIAARPANGVVKDELGKAIAKFTEFDASVSASARAFAVTTSLRKAWIFEDSMLMKTSAADATPHMNPAPVRAAEGSHELARRSLAAMRSEGFDFALNGGRVQREGLADEIRIDVGG